MSDAALIIRSTYSVLGRSCATGTTRGGIIQLKKRMNADILGSYLHQWILDTKTKNLNPNAHGGGWQSNILSVTAWGFRTGDEPNGKGGGNQRRKRGTVKLCVWLAEKSSSKTRGHATHHED
jgi:hypothetical protein